MGTDVPYFTSPKTTESLEWQHRPLPYDPVRDVIADIHVDSTDMALYARYKMDETLQKPFQPHEAQVISEQSHVS